ncbi:aminoacetone oxidase family FAD-binding enzyme [Candidatus Nomurabacteria bacterium]|nr:aminoacetone oxidase family FAD-binding enzyme [Candidatus Nomurabacteria bacterium]
MATNPYDVVVVGGGPAGMMAAGKAAALGKRVLLLEKNNRLGKKLRISGGGRCNITNAEEDERVLLRAYGKAEQFLYSIFSQFGNKDTFSFFESLNLPLVVQARKRAFPTTERAPDVVRALEQYLAKGGVTVLTGTPATKVVAGPDGIEGVVCGTERYSGSYYIFATGSISHPETGSTGDGFGWLRSLGHSVVAPTPTIVPLKSKDKWPALLPGTTLSNMKITFFTEGKKAFSKTGALLFTHFGISGPVVLNCAGMVSDLLYEGVVTAQIDTSPTEDIGALDKRLLAAFDAHKNKALKNMLKEVVEPGAAKAALVLMDQDLAGKKVHSITKEERMSLAKLLKALPLTIEGLMGFDRAVVADGGVPLDEVDMRTMRSKKVPNLSIIGDLLHITRPSGGYSLQLCWSTGFVAGAHTEFE